MSQQSLLVLTGFKGVSDKRYNSLSFYCRSINQSANQQQMVNQDLINRSLTHLWCNYQREKISLIHPNLFFFWKNITASFGFLTCEGIGFLGFPLKWKKKFMKGRNEKKKRKSSYWKSVAGERGRWYPWRIRCFKAIV